MRLTRCLILAAAFASLAFAGAAAAEPRHAPRLPAHPRAGGSPQAMDPNWASPQAPQTGPGWTMDYGPSVASPSWSRGGSPEADVQRMMNEMSRDMNAMMAGPAWGPLGFDLGFGDLGWGLGMGAGMGMGMPGFSGMGGPAGGASSWSWSADDDGHGNCRRTMRAASASTGSAPQSVARSDSVCDPRLMSSATEADDEDDADEPDEDAPEGR